MTEIKKVGVIGSGQMGAGIAQVCAIAGLDVVLNDVTEERIDHGLATISGNLARLVERKQIDEALQRSEQRWRLMIGWRVLNWKSNAPNWASFWI